MSIAVCLLMAWFVIFLLALLPKTMSEPEMVFLFCVNTIFALSIFTVVHLNLHFIDVSRSVEKSLADLVMRLITVPVLMIVSTKILQTDWKRVKWFLVVALVGLSELMQLVLGWVGVIKTPHWNWVYTVVMFSCYIAFSRGMAWVIRKASSCSRDAVA